MTGKWIRKKEILRFMQQNLQRQNEHRNEHFLHQHHINSKRVTVAGKRVMVADTSRKITAAAHKRQRRASLNRKVSCEQC